QHRSDVLPLGPDRRRALVSLQHHEFGLTIELALEAQQRLGVVFVDGPHVHCASLPSAFVAACLWQRAAHGGVLGVPSTTGRVCFSEIVAMTSSIAQQIAQVVEQEAEDVLMVSGSRRPRQNRDARTCGRTWASASSVAADAPLVRWRSAMDSAM